MHLHRLPEVMHRWLPNTIWRGPHTAEGEQKTLYLTFDDGPIPEQTPWVLEQLAQYEAKALFFCVGDNLERHPDIARAALAAGHQLGNHTYHHLSGWTTAPAAYYEDIARCQAALDAVLPAAAPRFFRPPYGRLTPAQNRQLEPDYRIVMWDLLTCDYDRDYASEKCLRDALRLTRPGSVVVFHDSLKASRNMRYVLPRYLEHFAGLGFRFELL